MTPRDFSPDLLHLDIKPTHTHVSCSATLLKPVGLPELEQSERSCMDVAFATRTSCCRCCCCTSGCCMNKHQLTDRSAQVTGGKQDIVLNMRRRQLQRNMAEVQNGVCVCVAVCGDTERSSLVRVTRGFFDLSPLPPLPQTHHSCSQRAAKASVSGGSENN